MFRIKFACVSVVPVAEGSTDYLVVFEARYDEGIPDDQRFFKWTPSGRIEMICNNPRVIAELKVGAQYYLDGSPA